MISYHLIRLNGTYLTDTTGVGGNRYVSEIAGLDKLKSDRQSTVIVPLEGPPKKQFFSNIGLPVSIKFELLPTATFDTFVSAMNAADNGSTTIALYITGASGTYNLSVVPNGMAFPATSQEAGLKSVQFNFVVSAVNKSISIMAGSYAQTGNALTLTHS